MITKPEPQNYQNWTGLQASLCTPTINVINLNTHRCGISCHQKLPGLSVLPVHSRPVSLEPVIVQQRLTVSLNFKHHRHTNMPEPLNLELRTGARNPDLVVLTDKHSSTLELFCYDLHLHTSTCTPPPAHLHLKTEFRVRIWSFNFTCISRKKRVELSCRIQETFPVRVYRESRKNGFSI